MPVTGCRLGPLVRTVHGVANGGGVRFGTRGRAGYR
jgi:hypothetical protein